MFIEEGGGGGGYMTPGLLKRSHFINFRISRVSGPILLQFVNPHCSYPLIVHSDSWLSLYILILVDAVCKLTVLSELYRVYIHVQYTAACLCLIIITFTKSTTAVRQNIKLTLPGSNIIVIHGRRCQEKVRQLTSCRGVYLCLLTSCELCLHCTTRPASIFN